MMVIKHCLISQKAFDKVELEKLYLDAEELKALPQLFLLMQEEPSKPLIRTLKPFTNLNKNGRKSRNDAWRSCWREARAIEKVGLYIPGGTAVLPSTF